MRYTCTSCDALYGEGENKPRYGFCADCWTKYLMSCKLNSEQLVIEWEKRKPVNGTPQTISKVKPWLHWWPVRWWKIKFFTMSIALRLNRYVCMGLRIPVRKYIIPRIQIKITMSRD